MESNGNKSENYKPGLGGKISAFKSNPQFIKNEDGYFDKNPGWVETDPETQYDYVEYDPNLDGNELSYEMKLKRCFIEYFQINYEKNRENYKSTISHDFFNLIPDEELRKKVLNSMFGTKSNDQLKLELDFDDYMDLMTERIIERYINHVSVLKILNEISELTDKIKKLNNRLEEIGKTPILPI